MNGFPNGPFAQGQGIAVVSATNLVDVVDDLVVASNRPSFGSGHLTDIRLFNLAGEMIGALNIPCSPPPVSPEGLAYYDIDYDEVTGTLVVASMEQRLAYVFKAQMMEGPAYPPFDYTRNNELDLHDFAGFQTCFTGGELPPDTPRLSLTCMRMNSDSDWDVDIEDYWAFEAEWDGFGGP